MQPAKNTAWTNPTLYFSEQINPNSDTVELPRPPTHSHEPASIWHTLFAPAEHPPAAPASVHRQVGSRSAKMTTMVWKASSAHAMLVSTKCLSCHCPNSPQYLLSISSMHILSTTDLVEASAAGPSSGVRRSGCCDS